MRNVYLFSICFFLFTIRLYLNTNGQTPNDSVSISTQTQQDLQDKVADYYRYIKDKKIKQIFPNHDYKAEIFKKTVFKDTIYKSSIAISALPILLINNNQYLPKPNINLYCRNSKVKKYVLSPKFNFLYKKTSSHLHIKPFPSQYYF